MEVQEKFLKLNAGCGEYPARGWINMDLHKKGPKPDLIGSLLDIPLENNSCAQVYCGHVLEHVSRVDVYRALEEIRRVLIPTTGELMIVGPDLDRTRKTDTRLRRDIIGKHKKSRVPGDLHLWVSTEQEMIGFLGNWNFTCLDIAKVPRKWPVVARVHWQYAIHCLPYA